MSAVGALASRTVGFLAYDGVQLLSIAGPSEVFGAANRAFAERGIPPLRQPYAPRIFSPEGGGVVSASGLTLQTDPLDNEGAALDTLVVPGGRGIRAIMAHAPTLDWLRATAPKVRRVVSFGGGAFILARAGLMSDRRCVTHWRFEADLVREYPDVKLVGGELFVRDGPFFSAAGGSASVDLTLRLVEEDHGKPIAIHVAHMMVLSRVRPGEQPQLGAELRAQLAATPRIAQAAEWIVDHVFERPSVADLARRFAMSERNFSRTFTREMGVSPQRFIDQTRLEAARRWLSSSTISLDAVARKAGFSGAEHMAQAFRRHLNVTPHAYRQAVQANDAAAPFDHESL
ncbi:MAG: helix-turn-helix domain-containing protein [Bordetella sp.]|nr:helix-turn-helix domain-containing protein [Bordetella sp.]